MHYFSDKRHFQNSQQRKKTVDDDQSIIIRSIIRQCVNGFGMFETSVPEDQVS